MKKLFIAFLFILAIQEPCYSEQILGVGDSIMYGYGGATNGPLPTLGSYLSMTYANDGVSATCISDTYTSLATGLSTHNPDRVYNNAGINDVRTYADECHSSMSVWLYTYYADILTDVVASSSVLYAMQITPCRTDGFFPTQHPVETIKIWNANLEDWAYANNVPLCPSYQDMSDNTPATSLTTDDNLKNTSDGLHPNEAGDGVLGYLMYNAGIPNRTRTWGSSSYPTMGHESWSWWIITGTGSVTDGSTDGVTGYNDGGTLSLSQSASAVSDVLSLIVQTGSLVQINNTTTQGAVSTSYRTSSTNFYRSDEAIEWTSYTGPFSMPTGHYFMQIKLANSEATTALVDYTTLDWTGNVVSYSLGAGCSLRGGSVR